MGGIGKYFIYFSKIRIMKNVDVYTSLSLNFVIFYFNVSVVHFGGSRVTPWMLLTLDKVGFVQHRNHPGQA